MQMTESEIVKRYEESAYKGKQINILADLNACEPSKIYAILEKHGVDLSQKDTKKKRGRPVGSVKKPQRPLTEFDQKLLSVLQEGVKTLDEEIQKHQDAIKELKEKRQAFMRFQEDIKS